METQYISLAAGLLLLYVGGELLIRGAESLASRLGMTPLLIGLTVVAFATSSPELVVSVSAALDGHGDVALGNVVGSNICNVALILGVAALIRPVRVQIQLLRIDVPILILCSGGLMVFLANDVISRAEATALLGGIIVYQGFCVWQARRETEAASHEIEEALPRTPRSPAIEIALIGIGVLALAGGGKLFVDGAVALATSLGVSPAVIALTLVALGTSLPELAATIVATVKGHSDMAAGSVIGSCIFNLLAVLGVTALIEPVARGEIRTLDLMTMTGFSVLLLPLMFSRFSITRAEGVLMIGCYAAYLTWLVT